VLDELGLVAALENYVGALPQSDAIETSFSVLGMPKALNPEAELAIFRIVQEACQNVVRHADAKSLRLNLTYSGNSVDVGIVDDGRGFVFDDAKIGLGLVGIRERTQVVGGELSVETAPGRGTRVMFSIPLQVSAA
jgi:signal transduction histidine kinase